jgi:TolB-like protein/DNA-binding winged helix-turn-helix (wHTH) protein/Tfp pilus assembly protein PilF
LATVQPPKPPDSVERRPFPAVYQVADLTVDTRRVTVLRDGHPVAVTGLTFDLLLALIEAAPRVVSQDELMDRVWSGLVVGPETVSQRIKLLRDALGDDPRHPRYVAGVRGRGYRLLPDVVRVDVEAAASSPAPRPASAPAPVAATRPQWQRAALAAGVVAVVGIGAWFLAREPASIPAAESAATAAPPARSVAVLAFENRGGAPGTDIFAEGIPETVLHQLGRFPGLTVISRGSSFAFKGKTADARDIGRRLNVRYLLEGSVQTAGTRLRVTSSLVDSQSGASVWSMQFDRAATDVFAVQDEIAIEVARAMQLTLEAGTEAVAGLRQGATGSYEAYLAFLRGRALLSSSRVSDLPKAAESLAAAIRHDPDFAGAYVLLARARVALAEQGPDRGRAFPPAYEQAMDLLDQAIRLEPENGDAFVERGYLKVFYDPAAADADLQRGISLSPNSARGYEGLATVMFQSVARRREALELIEKARRLDPLSNNLEVLKASYLFWGAGDATQAAAILQSVLEREPLYVPAIIRLAEVRWTAQGQYAEAVQLAEQAVSLDPGSEPAWRVLMASYLEMDESPAAQVAAQRASADPNFSALVMNVHRGRWREAGEAAYGLVASGNTGPRTERAISLAIARHARATGQFDRAIEALSAWALVDWDGEEPVLHGQLDLGAGVAALAEVMALNKQTARATALLEAFLEDARIQVTRYGRGVAWLNDARAKSLALLGRHEEALQVLEEQMRLGFGKHDWRATLQQQPAFEPLRSRKEYQALLATVQEQASKEREQLRQMRADGLVPDRRP